MKLVLKEEKAEVVVRMELEAKDDGSIMLVAHNGPQEQVLLSIDLNGELRLWELSRGIAESMGFKVDDDECLVVSKVFYYLLADQGHCS